MLSTCLQWGLSWYGGDYTEFNGKKLELKFLDQGVNEETVQ